jgi:tetratricopeptide (TPR) repeat protein
MKSVVNSIILLMFLMLLYCNNNENAIIKSELSLQIIDENHNPVPGVDFDLNGKSIKSDSDGYIMVPISSEGFVSIKKTGYSSVSFLFIKNMFIENDKIILKRIEDINIEELAAPTLIYPFKNAKEVPIDTVLRWQAVSGAESYTVKLNSTSYTVTGTSFPLSKVTLLPGTTNFWQITAYKGSRYVSSEQRSFITKDIIIISDPFDEGETYHKRGEWEKAINSYKKVRMDDMDKYCLANFKIAVINQNYLNQPRQALLYYDLAKSSSATRFNSEIYFNKGIIYSSLNDLNAAIESFHEASKYTLTGQPTEVMKKKQLLYYNWSKAMGRKALVETNRERGLKYITEAIRLINNYLDEFEDNPVFRNEVSEIKKDKEALLRRNQ